MDKIDELRIAILFIFERGLDMDLSEGEYFSPDDVHDQINYLISQKHLSFFENKVIITEGGRDYLFNEIKEKEMNRMILPQYKDYLTSQMDKYDIYLN